MKTAAAALALSLLLPCSWLRADEVRLRDGRVLCGKVTEEKGMLAVTTRDGVVRVPIADVLERTSEAALRQKLRELRKDQSDSPFAQLQLALQAHAWALEPETFEHLDAVFAAPVAERAKLQKRIDDFLAQLEPELLPRKYRAAATEARIKELLHGHRRGEGEGKRQARIEVLAREANADKDLREQARKNSDPARRELALAALLRRGTTGNDSFVWRSAILDPNQDVRTAAMAQSRELGIGEGAATYLAPGLAHRSAEVRVRTAEAFEALADVSTLRPLVAAAPLVATMAAPVGAGENRAHVAFLQSTSYIRDFDVEIASAAFIADPKVDVLQSGTVLDVTVHSIQLERVRVYRAYRKALHAIGGSDPGADPAAWPDWLQRLEASRKILPPVTPGASNPEPKSEPAPTTPGDGQKR